MDKRAYTHPPPQVLRKRILIVSDRDNIWFEFLNHAIRACDLIRQLRRIHRRKFLHCMKSPPLIPRRSFFLESAYKTVPRDNCDKFAPLPLRRSQKSPMSLVEPIKYAKHHHAHFLMQLPHCSIVRNK